MSLPDEEGLPQILLKGLKLVGAGVTSLVWAIDDQKVVKMSLPVTSNAYADNQPLQDIWVERKVYRRLGDHPRICKYISSVDHGIILERLGDSLLKHLLALRKEGITTPPADAFKWSRQAAQGLAYIHQKGVLQADVGCHNLLLDPNCDIKFCDFAGSSIDGSEARVAHKHRFQRWEKDVEPVASVANDLFALGATIYQIWTTKEPYEEESEEVVEQRYENHQFPDVQHLPVAQIIQKCWRGQYTAADEVSCDFDAGVLHLYNSNATWKPLVVT